MNLAAGGGILVVVLGALAFTAFRGRLEAAPDLRRALRAGFGFLIIGLAIGASMKSPSPAD